MAPQVKPTSLAHLPQPEIGAPTDQNGLLSEVALKKIATAGLNLTYPADLSQPDFS
jgi:hypothetical protein